jgi:hypothetical protein
MRALTTTWQAAPMSQTSVATDIHQTLDIGHDLTA